MTLLNLQVRRATVEDLPKLIPLWNEEQLPSAELQDRYKEFQVAESAEGELLGAMGLKIQDLEGLLHSEVFAHAEQADLLRDKLWERIQILAQNHGLVRMWTQFATPFWHSNGFALPRAEVFSKLPANFATVPGAWLVIQLREETAPAISLDKEFAMFREAQKAETEKLFRQAKVLKWVAGVLGLVVFILVIVWAVLFMKAQSRLSRPRADVKPPAIQIVSIQRASTT